MHKIQKAGNCKTTNPISSMSQWHKNKQQLGVGILLYRYTTRSSLSIHLLMDIQVASIHQLLIVMLLGTLGCVPSWISVFISPDKYPKVELLDHMAFWGTSIMFSPLAIPFYIPTNGAQRFPFLHISASIYYHLLMINNIKVGYYQPYHFLMLLLSCFSHVHFLMITILTGMREYSHHGFNFHFLDD